MAQEYLPAPSNVRLADLMKEHNISQPELAKEIGCSKSTISRFISGAKGTLTHEQVLKIARLFNVSTDFLLGETNIPDRKNYDIAELGLSVEAAKNLYTGRVNAEVVNLLLENARFAELTYRMDMFNTTAECIIDSLMKKDKVICNEKDLQLGTEYIFPKSGVRLWRERAFHPKLLKDPLYMEEMQAVLEDEYQYQYFQMVTIID